MIRIGLYRIPALLLLLTSFLGAQIPPTLEEREAVAPIVVHPEAQTFADIERAQSAWVDRLLIQPALKRLEDRSAEKWTADARKFLKEAGPVLFPERWLAPPLELANEGHKLIESGCDDPAICLMAAMLDQRTRMDWRFVRDMAEKAADFAKKDPTTPAAISYQTNLLIAWANKQGGFPKLRVAAEKRLIGNFEKMTKDGSYAENETELLVRHVTDEKLLPEGVYESFGKSVANTDLPEWAGATITGVMDANLAEKADRKERATLRERAMESLTKAWRLNSKSPIAAAEMMNLVMWDGEQTTRLWFDRAIAAQCDFEAAYLQMLTHQRSISEEALINFGKACFDTKRYDLDIPVHFTRACNLIAAQNDDQRALYHRPDIAAILTELSEGFVNEPSREYERPMRLSYLVVNSWLVGDFPRANAALKRLAGPLHSDVRFKLRTHRTSEQKMREEIALGSTPEASGMKVAETLFRAGDLDQAEEILHKLEASVAPELLRGVRERILLVEIERKLQTGEWVTLPVAPDLVGWEKDEGKWSATEEGVLINHGDDKYGGIFHMAKIGPDFEMKVNFSVEAKANCCQRCGVHFAWTPKVYETCLFASYGKWGVSKPYVLMKEKFGDHKQKKNAPPLQESNEIHLVCKDGKVTFSANGKPQYKELPMDKSRSNDTAGRIGIADGKWCRLNTTSIEKIQVKRLSKAGN